MASSLSSSKLSLIHMPCDFRYTETGICLSPTSAQDVTICGGRFAGADLRAQICVNRNFFATFVPLPDGS